MEDNQMRLKPKKVIPIPNSSRSQKSRIKNKY
jgi:hypothetical protein